MQKSAPTATIHDEVTATLKRLQAKNPGLKRQIKSAHGYAVFPSVGKASVVVGGAYGRGEVYEKGEVIGYATLSQLTIGVQLGGDTFSEVLIFQDKSSLDQFKRGKTSFAANASAVMVKAGAQGTKNPAKGVTALAFSRGGMLLELAIGGQKFSFKPMDDEGEGSGEGEEQGGEGQEQESGAAGLAGRTMSMVREHPVAATVIGLGVAAGVGLLVARKLRGGAASDEQDGQEGDQDDEEDRPEEEMSGDEGEEDDEREEDEDDDAREEDDEDGGDAEGSAGEEDEGEGDEGGEDEAEGEDRQAGRRQRGHSGGVLSRILGAGRSAAGGRR